MRTVTAAETLALSTGVMAVWVRVQVDSTGSGVFVDLGLLDGKDWVQEVSWSDNVDAPMASATVTLNRALSFASLSPFMTQSKYNSTQPLVAPGRKILIDACVTAPDASRPTTGWRSQFVGRIDDIDPASQGMVLTCRDIGCDLADLWIEQSVNYCSGGGQTILQVLNAILAQWVNTPYGLGVSIANTGPTWVIQTMANGLDKTSVLDALRSLVDPSGYVIRYMYGGTDTYALQFYQPIRTSTTSLQTFYPNWYTEVGACKISRMNIRNKIVVTYVPRTTPFDNNTVRTSTTYADATSQTAYGVRFMEISQDVTSSISTQGEADALGNAVLSDLSRPVMEHTVTMPFWGPTELGDLYTFAANRVHYDVDQMLAVTSWTHKISRDGASTEMGLRGKPSGAYRRWLKMGAAPGVAPNPSNDYGLPPTGILATPGYCSMTVDYALPPGYDGTSWAWSEIYYKLEDGNAFTQSSTGSPLQYARPVSTGNTVQGPIKGRVTRFVVPELLPGSTYRFVVVRVGTQGQVSPMTSQVTSAPLLVGATASDTSSAGVSILPNGDFQSITRGLSVAPDFWNVVGPGLSSTTLAPTHWTSTTPTANCWNRTQNAQTGAYSVAYSVPYTGASTYCLLSNWITLQGGLGSVYRLVANMAVLTVNANYYYTMTATLEAWDQTQTTLISQPIQANVTSRMVAAGPTSWSNNAISNSASLSGGNPYGVLPTNCQYARIRVVGSIQFALGGTAGAGTFPIVGVLDRLTLYRTSGRLARTTSSSTAGLTSTTQIGLYVPLPLGADNIPALGDSNRGFDTSNMGAATGLATVQASGTYDITATTIMAIGTSGINKSYSIAIYVYQASGGTSNNAGGSGYGNSDGVQMLTSQIKGIRLSVGDQIRLSFLITDAGQRNNTWSAVNFLVTPVQADEV